MSDGTLRFSIVIVSYNCRPDLERCLRSVKESFSAGGDGKIAHEIIVVDNSSSDGTRGVLAEEKGISVTLNSTNEGFSRACNVGAASAKGEFLIFLNPDTMVPPGWAEKMSAHLGNASVGAVGPLSNYVAGLQKYQLYAAGAEMDSGRFSGKDTFSLQKEINQLASRLSDSGAGRGVETRLLIGFCLMLRRELFHHLGGMDESLFLGNDDLDLSWRLRLQGYKLAVATDAFVFHAGQKSFQSEPKPLVEKLVQESTDALYLKLLNHYGSADKIPSAPELWGMDWFRPSPNLLGKAVGTPNADPARSDPMAVKENDAPSEEDAWKKYPVSLQEAMREATSIAFVGAQGGLPPEIGPVRGLDASGREIPLNEQDLIILRVTEEMMEGLAARLGNIRRRIPGLKKLIVIQKDLDQGNKKGFTDSIKAALWMSGYAISGEAPYHGLPDPRLEAEKEPPGTQIMAVPRNRNHNLDKKVSIIILGFNQVAYTRKCIESIRLHTRQSYELILVDNGSEDGTADFFHDVEGATVIINAENLGVAKGWNQGLRAARGDYLLIFNNDTIVTPGWLENMVRLAETDIRIGLVGPRSNQISGPQLIPEVPYKDEAGIQSFGREWVEKHELAAMEFERVTGFCMLMPRRVFASVGYFDERFGKGNFEDDDYCVRARYHGYRLFIAHDSFVHHFGSVSFRHQSLDWRAQMNENLDKFRKKWSKGAAALHDPVTENVSDRPEFEAPALEKAKSAYEAGDMELSRQLFLEAQATRPEDPEVYTGLGILCFHAGEYPEALTFLRKSLELRPEDEDTAMNILDVLQSVQSEDMRRRILQKLAGSFPQNTLFHKALDQRPGHSSPAPTPAPSPSSPSDAGDWNAQVEDLIRRKSFSGAIDIIEGNLLAGISTALCHNYLGIIAFQCADFASSFRNFELALRSDPGNPDILLNYFDAGITLGRRGEMLELLEEILASHKGESGFEELEAGCRQLRKSEAGPDFDPRRIIESRERNISGENLLREGLWEKARETFEEILAADAGDYRARNNLGLVAWYQGRQDEAWENFIESLRLNRTYGDALINGFDAALVLKKVPEFKACILKALEQDPENLEAKGLIVQLEKEGLEIYSHNSYDELEASRGILGKAETDLEQGDFSNAIQGFLDVLERHPRNPQALNGLGVVAFQKQRFSDSFGFFSMAASYNPLDQEILLNLWDSAVAANRGEDALPFLRSSLETDPSLEGVKAILESHSLDGRD